MLPEWAEKDFGLEYKKRKAISSKSKSGKVSAPKKEKGAVEVNAYIPRAGTKGNKFYQMVLDGVYTMKDVKTILGHTHYNTAKKIGAIIDTDGILKMPMGSQMKKERATSTKGPKGKGIGVYVMAHIKKHGTDFSNTEFADKVREKFGSNTTPACISWYKGKAKKLGLTNKAKTAKARTEKVSTKKAGIATLIRAMIANGKGVEEVGKALKNKFPDSTAAAQYKRYFAHYSNSPGKPKKTSNPNPSAKKPNTSRKGALIKGMTNKLPSEILANSVFKSKLDEIMKGYSGIYALYNDARLYYVGLTNNLRGRINQHLKDRHARKWTEFVIFRIKHVKYLKDIETLLLNIHNTPGNRHKGKVPLDADINRLLLDILKQHEKQMKSIKKALK